MSSTKDVFTKKDIKALIDHIITVRTKRYNKLRKDGADSSVSISFMIGSNCVLSQLQYFYENGEINKDESNLDK